MSGLRRWLHPVATAGLTLLVISVGFLVYSEEYVLARQPLWLTVLGRLSAFAGGLVALIGIALTVGDEIVEKRFVAAVGTGTLVVTLLALPVLLVPPGPDNAPIGWCGLLFVVLPVIGAVLAARILLKRRRLLHR